MIPDNPLPENREALIARVTELIRGGRVVVMGVIDAEQHLVISSMGIDPRGIPQALRYFADHVEREEAEQEVRKAVDELPPERRGTCPGCEQPVVVTKPIPAKALLRTGGHALCVCTCGAFLVPSLGEGGNLQLRFMTDTEIADLPDGVRNGMLRVRREFQELQRQSD